MKKTGFLIVVLAFVGMTSCKKEGCTDSAANNYNVAAKKDDASCTYSTTVVVWWDKSTSEYSTSWGAKTAKVYLNGELLKSLPSNKYWNSAPNCTDTDAITKTYDLGNSKSKLMELKIEHLDSAGTVIITGSNTQNVAYGECVSLQGI